MQNQNTKMLHGDSDVDLTHKINTIELDNWINHLKYIKNELAGLVNLCSTEFSLKLPDDNVLKLLQKKEAENVNLLNALNRYLLSRVNIIECEDTQCDMVYITEHESYRRSYLHYLDKYRRFKSEFFTKAQGEFTLLNKNKN